MSRYNVAIVGVTGMVGQAFIKILQERKFPVRAGNFWPPPALPIKIRIAGRIIPLKKPGLILCRGRLCFFSAGGDISLQLAPEAVKRGAIVVDNSSAFRMDRVPLVVPEVNAEAVRLIKGLSPIPIARLSRWLSLCSPCTWQQG